MANFPGSSPVFTGFTSTHTLSQDNHAAQHNLEQAEIVALAAKVGTGASSPTSGTVLRGTGSGISAYGQVVLSSEVTGILPVGSGGTGQANLTTLPLSSPVITGTVTGGASYTSPTITTPTITVPTIADFSNATHTHASNMTGGTLNAGNALQAGTVTFSNLLSSIFSGQVSSQANAGTAGGTMYYVNLGGIKILWSISAQQTSGSGGNQYTFTLPTSFFSTIQLAMTSVSGLATDARQYANVESSTTTTVTVNVVSAGAATAGFGLLVIGT